MNNRIKIFSITYLLTTSVTVLVMLVASFEQFNEKYLPSFMLAQKFALPVIAASLAFVFLVFFEPERLERRSNLIFMRVVMAITAVLFFYFISTINMKATSQLTMSIYILELITTIAVTVFFFLHKPKH